MSSLNLTADQALAAFKRYVGIGEHPPGSNKNAITAWYGAVGAWCAMTLSKVLDDLGILKLVLGRAMAYTVDIYTRGQKMGWLVNPAWKYEPGDIVLFNFGDVHWGGRPLGIHHVGMVRADLGGGMFADYEGNTSNDCLPRVRNKRNVAAVVRPPWKHKAPAHPYPGHRIHKGDSGASVRLIQRALIAWGYHLPKSTDKDGRLDGLFGDETAHAVLSARRRFWPGGKAETAVVGPRTWRRLMSKL